MNNKGFIMYESIIIFIIVSFLVLTCLTIFNQTIKNNYIIEKKIETKYKYHNTDDGKVCAYECLIKKGLLP